MSTGKEVGGDTLKGRGRISSFFPFVPYRSVTAGEPVFLTATSSLCLLSHVLCLRLWPTSISCLPPALSLSPFTPSKATALRPIARLASTAFYFGLYLWVWGGGCSWARSWEQRRKVWAAGLSATRDVLSRPAALGPTRGGKGGGSREAAQPVLRSCTTAIAEVTWAREFALACAAPGTAAVPAWAPTAGLKIGCISGFWRLIPIVALRWFEQGTGLHILKRLLTCW